VAAVRAQTVALSMVGLVQVQFLDLLLQQLAVEAVEVLHLLLQMDYLVAQAVEQVVEFSVQLVERLELLVQVESVILIEVAVQMVAVLTALAAVVEQVHAVTM
jgi:hypothetical protein